MEEIVRVTRNQKPLITVLKQCFRHELGTLPWIGFRYHGDRDAYLWVNGEEVEEDSTNWAAGEVMQGYTFTHTTYLRTRTKPH